MKRIAITGASGYLGQRLVAALTAVSTVEHILTIDLHPGQIQSDKISFVRHDVTQPFDTLFAEHAIDTAVHLAYILDPIHDVERERAVNVDGTRHFFAACAAAQVQTLLLASSATVYGAWPDNPPLLSEDDPLRGKPGFGYVEHKLLMEQAAVSYQQTHPDSRVLITRVAVALGPNIDNYLSRFFKRPLGVMVRGHNPLIGVVHEDDVARAKLALLQHAPAGAYNICAEDPLTLREILEVMNVRPFALPAWLLLPLADVAWRLRLRFLTEAPPLMLDYVRYSWAVNGRKLTQHTPFTYTHTSSETVIDFVEG